MGGSPQKRLKGEGSPEKRPSPTRRASARRRLELPEPEMPEAVALLEIEAGAKLAEPIAQNTSSDKQPEGKELGEAAAPGSVGGKRAREVGVGGGGEGVERAVTVVTVKGAGEGNSWSLSEALVHLRKEGLGELIDKHGAPTTYNDTSAPKPHPFVSLCRAIVYQQLAGAAASTIWKRFLRRMANLPALEKGAKQPEGEGEQIEALLRHVTPSRVLEATEEELRGEGLSERKASYVKDLAAHFAEGQLEGMEKMSDEELRRRLIAVRGVGEWTVDMFMIFTSHRPDVFPVGDLAVVKGVAALLGVNAKDKQAVLKVAERWRPYRSVATWYMYRLVGDMNKSPKKK